MRSPQHEGDRDIGGFEIDGTSDVGAFREDPGDGASGDESDGPVADVLAPDADAGPGVFVKDMCTGARPDGGVMDVAPSCGPPRTGKGGEMCRVPGGPVWIGADCDADDGPCYESSPFHEVIIPTFEMGRYEVTVGDYGACAAAGACTQPRCDDETTPSNSELPDREDHPVNCVNWKQASTYCWWAGKRLPSEAEWEKAARGTDGRWFPWGDEKPDCGRGVFDQLHCGVNGTGPVGTKPAGTSPYGIEDMVGNVAEWTADHRLLHYFHALHDGLPYVHSWGTTGSHFAPAVRGQSWWDDVCLPPSTCEQGTFVDDWFLTTLFRTSVSSDSANILVGFRCVASADDSTRWRNDANRASFRKVAPPPRSRTMTGQERPLPAGRDQDAGVNVVCGPSPTGRGGAMCDVPEGSFPMGCREIETPQNSYRDCDSFPDEIPVHEVWLRAFKIDKFEVTAAEYSACVEAGTCGLPGNINVVCDERCTYPVPGWEDHPINCVLWENARDYCTWVGKRLPSEAEWEKAAGGPEGRFWPWGNDLEIAYTDRKCSYAVLCPPDYGPWHVEPVGTRPLGASPYGPLDMIGNVWEWTNDWYDQNYYENSPPADPPGPPGGYAHVLRGGSPSYPLNQADNKTRLAVFHPAYWSETVGFRCAY